MKNKLPDTWQSQILQVNKPHLLSFASFFIYLIYNNLVYNFLSLIIFQDVHVSLYGRICNAPAPDETSLKQILFYKLFVAIRYIPIFLFLQNSKPTKVNPIIYLLPINILLLDGVSFFFYSVDNSIFDFAYFLSSMPLYSIGNRLQFASTLIPCVNGAIGVILMGFLLKKNKMTYPYAFASIFWLCMGVLASTFALGFLFNW